MQRTSDAPERDLRDKGLYQGGIALQLLFGGGMESALHHAVPVGEALEEIALGTGDPGTDLPERVGIVELVDTVVRSS